MSIIEILVLILVVPFIIQDLRNTRNVSYEDVERECKQLAQDIMTRHDKIS